MQKNTTVIAYPISPDHKNLSMDENVYSNIAETSFTADDGLDMNENFFSQLDSMIAAVKVESSALDSMKEKLKEADGFRAQIQTFTKRLLDADQANLNLKTNLVKVQEAYAELKKQKADVESSIVPLRTELNRAKEMYSKERMARLSAQQEITMLKDQIMRIEKMNENLDRESKSIPALVESNEILKNELAQLRKRFKEEKGAMVKQIKFMETQARDVEGIKGEVRVLALKLLDVASNGAGNTGNNNYQSAPNTFNNLPNNGQQLYNSNNPMMTNMNSGASMKTMNTNGNNMNGINNINNNSSNIHYERGFDLEEDEDDEYGDDNIGGGNDSEYDNASYVEDINLTHSIESMGSQIQLSPPQQRNNININNNNNNNNNANRVSGGGRGSNSDGTKKKRVKKVAGRSNSMESLTNNTNMMQSLPNNDNTYGNMNASYRGSGSNNNTGNMQQNFSLPRIH